MTSAWVSAGLWLGFAAAASSNESALRSWCAKEGAVERASVGVLLAMGAAWGFVLWRSRARDPWAIAMLAFAILVVGEELDWGAVVGVGGVGEALQGAVGHRNLHNFAGGHGYLLFAIVPAVAVVAALRRAPSRYVGAPTRADAIGLVVAAVPTIASALAWPRWADELDEFGELVVYVALFGWSIGATGRARGLSSST
jgi:hypothetical protein